MLVISNSPAVVVTNDSGFVAFKTTNTLYRRSVRVWAGAVRELE